MEVTVPMALMARMMVPLIPAVALAAPTIVLTELTDSTMGATRLATPATPQTVVQMTGRTLPMMVQTLPVTLGMILPMAMAHPLGLPQLYRLIQRTQALPARTLL